MNGPSARALREGGQGGSIPYKLGVTLSVRMASGGPLPHEWRRKTTLQEPFGDFGQILRIVMQEAQGVAYVEYEDKLDAEDAEKTMQGKQIAGKDIIVQMAGKQESRRFGAPPMPVVSMGVGAGIPTSMGVLTSDFEKRILEISGNRRLDEPATVRLCNVFRDRARLGCDIDKDLDELDAHLAASNKPSALVSMKLAELRSGRPIGPCKYHGSRGGSAPEGTLQGSDGVDGRSMGAAVSSRGEVTGRGAEKERESMPSMQKDRGEDAERDGARKSDHSRWRTAEASRERSRRRSKPAAAEKAPDARHRDWKDVKSARSRSRSRNISSKRGTSRRSTSRASRASRRSGSRRRGTPAERGRSADKGRRRHDKGESENRSRS